MEQPHEPMRKRAERLYNSLFQSKMECNFGVGYDSISFEDLLDSFLILYDECNNEFLMKDSLIAEFVDKFRTRMLQLRNLCINPSDFEVVKVISRGRFSEVSVVKEKGTCRVYVSKKLHKADILDAREIYFENERNIMLLACKHSEAREWVPRLFYSFHNLTHMYFIVEYCPGGNLRTMLEYYKKNVPEPMLRFYMAEMIRAIHSIHSMGFVHRNIKPDNIVVDASGHLKLIDFRSSVKCGGNGRICAKLPSHVFKYAPDYIAPEIFEFHETSTNGYGVHCDWWSLGIVLHELITGSVPFTRNDVNKLHQWSNYSRKLQHQKLTSVSQELRNIVTGLLQPAEKRLNYEKITRLNYFNDLDWNQLRERDPPFVPSLTSADDTSYCTTCEVQSSTSKTEDLKLSRRFTGRNLPFLGFTFMGNLFEEKSSDEGSRLAPKIVVARRKSDIFKKNFPEFVSNVPRSSTGVTRNSGIASDCSNDSYQSAASDMYNCMTGDQHKLLQEKEQLMNQLKVKDEEFTFKIETLLNKNGQLENEMAVLRRKFENTIDCNDELNKNHEKEIDELKKSYEEEINKLRKTDKLKKDAVTKLNSEVQKLKKELAETSAKLKETELKLLTVSNQQAAKLAMTRTTLRSRSVERNKYEQENVTLKNELAQAKKEITKLKTEIERKNKMKLDLEVKMTTKNGNDRRSFHAECKDDDKLYVGKLDPEEFIRQIESAVREVLKENVSDKESSRNLDVESMVSTLQRKLSILNEHYEFSSKNSKKQSNEESSVVADLKTQIARLESLVDEAKQLAEFERTEVARTNKELMLAEKQMAEMKVELQMAQKETKLAEERVKQLQANPVDSVELMKQFENTMTDVRNLILENMSSKESVKVADLEVMFKTVQRKLSILSERQLPSKENAEEKEQSTEPPTVTVLQSHIERLETQLDKAKESAILHREAASHAKKELAAVEKQLADLKIDLRIAQREASTAEEEVKQLKKSKYTFFKELRDEKQILETQLQEVREILKQSEEEMEILRCFVKEKEREIAAKESNLNDESLATQSLSKEVQSLKTKIENVRQEKLKAESETKNRALDIEALKMKIEQLKGDLKTNECAVTELKKHEDAWRTKCLEAETTIASLKDTCGKLDALADSLEEDNRKFREENSKLREELDRIKEELKSTRKMANEEKSTKIFVENKFRLLETDIRKREEKTEILEADVNSKQQKIHELEEEIRQLEEYLQSANTSVEKSVKYTESLITEITTLKKDRTELLTFQHRLKEENNSLRNEVQELTDELNDQQQANGELQSVLAQAEAYHEIRHKTTDEILQQHSKLVDFLRTKFQDASKPKRTFADKLFRSKGKENLNPKEMENLLLLERNKSKALTEQLYQAQIELKQFRETRDVSECTSPKQNSESDSCRSRIGSNRNQLISSSALSESNMPMNVRLKHNIPHKFDTRKCKNRGCKCTSCGQPIAVGQLMSRCKECYIWSHVPCSVKVGPTCGLSTALLEQFSTVNKYHALSSTSTESAVKNDIVDTVKVLRNKTWEKMIINIEDDGLLLFDQSSSQTKSTERIPFSTVVSVDDNVSRGHCTLENISDAEKRCILKIIYRTACKQQNVIYMLALNEEDKVNWMNVLKRTVSGPQKQVAFNLEPKDCFRGRVVCQFEKPNNVLNANQMIQLSPELSIVAADEGLFSLKLNMDFDTKPNMPVKISGIGKIKSIKALTKLRIALMICEDNDMVRKCDLRMLVSNAEAAKCSSPCITTTDVSALFCPLNNCRLLGASLCNNFLAVTTTSSLMILEWKEEGFDLLKYKKNISDIICMQFTPRCLLICSTANLFSVNLNTFEENKLNVGSSVSGGEWKQWQPETIVKISRDLYLICDKLFGTFVNAEGKRIKSTEMLKWPLAPQKIVYNKPFLCIAHESNVSLVYLPPTDEDCEGKFKFCVIDFQKPFILGIIKEPVRGILIKDETETGCKLHFLDPDVFMRRNPKLSWSSISTQSIGETTDEECIRKSLNLSDETEISLNSSILEVSGE